MTVITPQHRRLAKTGKQWINFTIAPVADSEALALKIRKMGLKATYFQREVHTMCPVDREQEILDKLNNLLGHRQGSLF